MPEIKGLRQLLGSFLVQGGLQPRGVAHQGYRSRRTRAQLHPAAATRCAVSVCHTAFRRACTEVMAMGCALPTARLSFPCGEGAAAGGGAE
eukprot:SAG11_NODE_8999_length_955_cov_0.954439_1_plen_90_part_10